MPIRDVRTRWNSTHALLERAVLLRQVIKKWVEDRDELEHLRLSNHEWEQLEAVCELLEVSDSHSMISCSVNIDDHDFGSRSPPSPTKCH